MTGGADEHPFAIRPATVADAEPLVRGVIAGVEDYPAFAPPGWQAPSLAGETAHVHAVLEADEAWCLVAEGGGEIVGQVTLLSARRAPRPVDDAVLAHISNLFVRRDRWGSGLAQALIDAAEQLARDMGFERLRLFVAEGQARARRFYEREGWSAASEPFHDPVPGLAMIEYRIELPSG